MDVRTSGAVATVSEREAIASVLGGEPPGGSRVVRGGRQQRSRRHLLLPALHALQDASGWISRGAIDHLAERMSIGPAEIYGIASFYHMLATEPRPPLAIHVCDDIACRAAGAGRLRAELESRFGAEGSEAAPGAAWRSSPCLGHCEHGSAALVRRAGTATELIDVAFGPVTADQVGELLNGGRPAGPPEAAVPTRAPQVGLLRRASGPRLLTAVAYEKAGGFLTLRRLLAAGPEAILAELAGSGVVGRGGAAFPTARKWEAVARATEHPHYVVCNADESEPGTFKDRLLLERDAFGVIEGLMIAGVATGSERGYIYLRDEYPHARAVLESALAELRAAGWLGPAFEIELRRGAGAYICGEETALLNSIEGRRGEPRNRPPFPVERGLFGKPTAINNVETLLAALEALGGSPGGKLFSVSGNVVRPGVYELEAGATLGRLLDLAGGVAGGRSLQAVLLGGAAGSLVGPGRLDLPLTVEGTRAAGLSLGSGAVIVFDDQAQMGEILLRVARFFRQESCGQCVPCRVGTVRQEEALVRLLAGTPLGSREDELIRLRDVAQVMRDASICGLGQTAANAVQSGLNELGARL